MAAILYHLLLAQRVRIQISSRNQVSNNRYKEFIEGIDQDMGYLLTLCWYNIELVYGI